MPAALLAASPPLIFMVVVVTPKAFRAASVTRFSPALMNCEMDFRPLPPKGDAEEERRAASPLGLMTTSLLLLTPTAIPITRPKAINAIPTTMARMMG